MTMLSAEINKAIRDMKKHGYSPYFASYPNLSQQILKIAMPNMQARRLLSMFNTDRVFTTLSGKEKLIKASLAIHIEKNKMNEKSMLMDDYLRDE